MKITLRENEATSQLTTLIQYLKESYNNNPNPFTDQFLQFCKGLSAGEFNAENINSSKLEVYFAAMRYIRSNTSHPLNAKFNALEKMLPDFVRRENIDLVITKLKYISQFMADQNLQLFLIFCHELKSKTIMNDAAHADKLGSAFHAIYNLEARLYQEQSELIGIMNECKDLLPQWVRDSYQTVVERLQPSLLDDWQEIPFNGEPEPIAKKYKINGNTIVVSGQFDNNAILRFYSLCAERNLQPEITRKADGFSLNNIAGQTAIYESLLVRFLAPTLVLVDKKVQKPYDYSTDVTVFVRGQFIMNDLTQFMALCIGNDLKPTLKQEENGFSISDHSSTIERYRSLVQSYFGIDVESNSMVSAKSMRFSTNSNALQSSAPSSINSSDISQRNPFIKQGPSIFIPGQINDELMVEFESECIAFGLNPEYSLTQDGCFIRDRDNDKNNLINYKDIMARLMPQITARV